MITRYFKYHHVDHHLVDTGLITPDKGASQAAGHDVYLLPSNSTTIAPPENIPTGAVAVFDVDHQVWTVVEDQCGKICYRISDASPCSFDWHGALTAEYTSVAPDEYLSAYQQFDSQSGKWLLKDDCRNDVLNAIWDLRKDIRDQQCDADLEYHGNLFHVDPTSLVDLNLAAQSAMYSGDLDATRRWVTADSINVEVSGHDLLAILRAYGARREQLVFESNDAWQSDTLKSNDELIACYHQLLNRSDENGI